MEVQYASSKLEKRCTNDKAMHKQYSAAVAKSLNARIIQLRKANNVNDLFAQAGNWHPLTGNYRGYVAGSLSSNWRILIRGVDSNAAEISWQQVQVVSVEEITDYH